jgi:hypothetical protein
MLLLDHARLIRSSVASATSRVSARSGLLVVGDPLWTSNNRLILQRTHAGDEVFLPPD